MKRILIIGAGMSSIYLIKYLEEQAAKYGWEITVTGINVNIVKKKTCPDTLVAKLNVLDDAQRDSIIEKSDIVVSMLPASLHIHVARSCLKYSKSLLTASYESDEIRKMRNEVKAKNNEASKILEGLSIYEGRKKIVEELKKNGLYVKSESSDQSIKVCERCKTPTPILRLTIVAP